jgi:hypothetical protein
MTALRLAIPVLALAGAVSAGAQDVLGVATIGGAPGQTRDVTVTVRDVAGTLLDEGDGINFEIQGFAFRVDVAPAGLVTPVTFLQAGVTAGHTPVFPVVTVQPDHVIVLMSFDETTDPLAFTLNAAPPGNVIGMLRFTISPSAPLGTVATLTVAQASATLVNGAATLSETIANGHLDLVDGAIVIQSLIFAGGFESGNFAGWSIVVGG